MSGAAGNRLPSDKRKIEELEREIRKLWQAISRTPAAPAAQEEKTYSWSGSVSPGAGRTSGPWFSPGKIVITSGTMGWKTGASGTVTVSLLVDGVSSHTFSIVGGQTRAVELVRIPVSYGSSVQALVGGASGGSDLTFTIGFVREVGSL